MFMLQLGDCAPSPALAGEGWGGGVSARRTVRAERAPPRALGPTSPASGRGEASSRLAAQASFTVSALKSLPSVSNTFLTMLLASRPALAYITAGESWTRNTSGRRIQ